MGIQRPHSGASPPRGSPDWRHDHCWNRHCGRAGAVTGGPHRPAWRSHLPGVPGSLSPGKARRWRVSGGSWSCVRGRDALASSKHPSGPVHCTPSCSFRSWPRQGGSGYLWAGERKWHSQRETHQLSNVHQRKKKSSKSTFVKRNGVI